MDARRTGNGHGAGGRAKRGRRSRTPDERTRSLSPPVENVAEEEAGWSGTGAAYPRRRAAIACDTCRARKTRCDGAKPVCSFCAQLEIECTYRKPAQVQRPRPDIADDVLGRVEAQLNRIETLLGASVKESRPRSTVSSQVSPASTHGNDQSGITPLHSLRSIATFTSSEPFSNQSDNRDAGLRSSSPKVFNTEWPDLESCECLPPLNPIKYDEREEFYVREIERGDQFCYADSALPELDLSLRTCRRLQQYFARNVLNWLPLFDQQYLVDQVSQLVGNPVLNTDHSTALVLLALSLGAISNDDEHAGDDVAGFAGIEYFLHGFRMVSLMRPKGHDIVAVHCNILSSLYFLYTMRPVQAMSSITQASSDLLILFKMRRKMAADPKFHQLAVRAFWACYIIEYEISGKISGYLASLPDLIENMHLPSSGFGDTGSYFFLGEIALRKLISRVMDLVGYSGTSSGTTFAPIIVLELHKQLSDWYRHLPSMLKFPIDSSIVTDPQKAFMRAQYFSILAVTNWTFILKLLDTDPAERINKETLVQQGRQAIESAILYILSLESMMFSRHMMVSVNCKGLYSVTLMLLSVYGVPELAAIQVPGIEQAVRKAVEMIDTWRSNPSIAVAVDRILAVMDNVGISRDGENVPQMDQSQMDVARTLHPRSYSGTASMMDDVHSTLSWGMLSHDS